MTVSRPTEFGAGIGGTLAPGEYPAIGRALEEQGFHVATVFGDLMMQPPILPLASMASATERIRLGVGAYTPWTHHPVEIAGQLAFLDHLSGGRAFFGIVRGAWLDQLGLRTQRALPALRDTVEIVRSLLRRDGSGYQGSFYQVAPGTLPMYPVHRPAMPLMIGTWSPRLAEWAGTTSDEVQVGGSANARMVPVMRERIRPGEVMAGRPEGTVRIVMTAVTVLDEDGAAARAKARTEVALPFHAIARLDPTCQVDPELLDRMGALLAEHRTVEAGALIPDDLLGRFTFSGTPGDVIEQATEIYEAGATRIEFDTPFGLTEHGGIRLLGQQVLPALRARGLGFPS